MPLMRFRFNSHFFDGFYCLFGNKQRANQCESAHCQRAANPLYSARWIPLSSCGYSWRGGRL